MNNTLTVSDGIKKIPRNNYITNYTVAQSIVDECTKAWWAIWELIRRCQLHLQGEPPVTFEALKKRGLDWCSRENFLKATAIHQKLTAESVADVWKSMAMSYVTFREYNEKKDKGTILEFLQDDGTASICSMAVGCAFASMLAEENRMIDFFNAIEYPSIAFGFSALMDKEDDWLPDVIHPYDIGFRPQSKPSEIPCWIVFQTISAKTLWGYWEKCKNDGKSGENPDGLPNKMSSKGWNILALEEVLWRVYRGQVEGSKNVPENWADVLQQFNKSSSLTIQNTDDVTVAKIYYEELDGTLSLVYIPYSDTRDPKRTWAVHTPTQQGNSVDLVLFRKSFNKEQAKKKLKLIRESGYTETSNIEDYRGLAKFTVKDSISYNQTRNGVVDKIRLIGCPWFEKGNSQQGEAFKLGVGSAFIIGPVNYQPMQNQPKYDIQSPLMYLGFQEKEFSRETEHYDADLKLSSRPNKSEVQAQQNRMNELNSNKNVVRMADYSNLFYSILKKLGSININSLSENGKQGKTKFFSYLNKYLKYVLPQDKKSFEDSDLKLIIDAVDSFILEPFVQDVTVLTIAERMAESPFARNRYKRMLLVAQGFPLSEVNIACPLITTKMADYGDHRIAYFENDLFTISPKIIQFNDDDIAHLDIHVPKGQQIVQGFEAQQITADYAFKYLVNLNNHIFLHIQKLGNDPVLHAKAEPYIAEYKKLKQAETQIRIEAEKQMEAQARKAQEAQLDPEAQADIARKNAQAIAKEDRTNRLQENRTQQSYAKIESDKQVGLARVEAEKEVEMARVQGELSNENGANSFEQVTP